MKSLKTKEAEYRAVRDYVIDQSKKLYPGMPEEMMDQFVKEATWGICLKYKMGYRIGQTCLGYRIQRNKLRSTLNAITDEDIGFVRKLIDLIDKTNYNLKYTDRAYFKDEEE